MITPIYFRVKQALANERESDYYHTTPDILTSPDSQEGIPSQQPSETVNGLPNSPLQNGHSFYENDPMGKEYQKLSPEKDSEHPYGELTPVDEAGRHAVPNEYQVLPF